MIIPDPSLGSLPQELWEKAIEKMILSAKQNDFYQGFDQALHFVAAQLAKQFPTNPNNINELPNQVIIKD
jgi:uncharacterized membrane protein